MSSITKKGYIIDYFDHNENDQIIKILFDDNTLTSLISVGSKKILSKNGRYITLGSLHDFEFFQARSIERLSKLKKIHKIDTKDATISESLPMVIMHYYLNKKSGGLENNFFNFYDDVISYVIKQRYSNETIIIYILLNIINLEGIAFQLLNCGICNSKQVITLSFKKMYGLCEKCAYEQHEFLYDKNFMRNIFWLIYKNDYEVSTLESRKYISLIKGLASAIYHNAGIYLEPVFSYLIKLK
ncbi:DNA repair protein RecO [Mycoplasmoides gallisepticum]|uniref:DNA repair protein RecO n=2 Tax=Mycoplasmoides gallisepticum TaxID=2096 RepID=A0AB36DTW9_MYCGL|nr:recombination protein O N-terminal domain-containing protein [Mycoplasmoides gallisepticum]ADC31370.1 putative recombinational DNA repair protein RecO [Mycoplasmoides gallisepticum str. F]AHB99668.1 recombinase [Mycoplasmoides gallisepticum S6]OBU78774.1 DNA repair protein RecO [Mycoplasmoides gallisepticum]OBU79151.1 DNA repair protein RecO [Mycoplasmoides gallisepticum]OBU79645.1 DNA repair protein RecO [Mycoplasmoides gallisepticum]